MELAGLFLLLLLPPSDASGDLSAAVERSLHQELGDVRIAIAPDTLVTPAMVRGKDGPMRARFVAHLVWLSPDQARIDLISTMPGGPDTPGQRSMRFAAQDVQSERGRAIGLVIAELLRESPTSAWAISSGQAAVGAGSTAPAHLALSGLFTVERIRAGNWAMGPELCGRFGLGHGVWLGVVGAGLFSSTDQYSQFELGAHASWDFVRSADDRHGLGVALELVALRDSVTATLSDDHNRIYSRSAQAWTGAVSTGLRGHLTLWRALRVVGRADLRSLAKGLSSTVADPEEGLASTVTASRYRPHFALGLEYAL
jgi:hypothetical protein